MAEQKQLDVNEPSRRRLLKGIGALGGALAITGGCPVAHAAKGNSSPGVLSPDHFGQLFHDLAARNANNSSGGDVHSVYADL